MAWSRNDWGGGEVIPLACTACPLFAQGQRACGRRDPVPTLPLPGRPGGLCLSGST